MKHTKLLTLCICMLALVMCLLACTALAEGSGSRVLMAGNGYDDETGAGSENVFGNPGYDRTTDIIKVVFTSSLSDKPAGAWDVSAKKDGSVFAWVDADKALYIGAEGGVLANPDCSELFSEYRSLKEIAWNNAFDTSNATDMQMMFYGCGQLDKLDVSGFNTSNVTDMSGMFRGCSNLGTLDVSGFDTSNVTYMDCMFYGCSNLAALGVSGFDTSNVTDMYGMFAYCQGLKELDVSGFDTSNVTNMAGMFAYCQGLKELDVSGFNTSCVTNLGAMFRECQGLGTLDVSGFDTSNATNMNCMFDSCSGLKALDISNFDMANVTDAGWMFWHCYHLRTLYVSSAFDAAKIAIHDEWDKDMGLYVGGTNIIKHSQATDVAGEVVGYVIVIEGTNVRGDKSSDSDLVGYVAEEGVYPCYETAGSWYKIRLKDGTMGYVYQSRVK